MRLKLLSAIMALPAILFIVFGLRWLVIPDGIAPFFGMTMMEGVGLSSQIGDMAAIFLTIGISALAGLVSGNRIWFLVPTIFLILTAIGRILAWGFHDATLATDFIVQEFLVAALWFFGSKHVCNEEKT